MLKKIAPKIEEFQDNINTRQRVRARRQLLHLLICIFYYNDGEKILSKEVARSAECRVIYSIIDFVLKLGTHQKYNISYTLCFI